jgi:Spy/CpxP family protein refolding chaperone
MTKQWAGVLGLVLLASALVLGQDGGPQAPGAPGQAPPPGAPGGMSMQRRAPGPAELHRREMGPPTDGLHGPGMHGPGMHGPGGKWWKSDIAQQIGLSEQQAQQMEKIYQDQRMQLIDLRATLEKQEAALEPLIEADQPNEQQVLGQIDKIAQARAALEKSNAQMHFSMRRVLTSDQWKKLQAEHMHPQPMPRRHMAPGPGPDDEE